MNPAPMSMRTIFLATSLAVVATACCLGCDADPGDEPALATSIAGSYDFLLTTIDGYPAVGSYPADPNGPRQPSAGLTGRLDLRRSGDGFEAVLQTHRWPVAVTFGAQVVDRELVLRGTCISSQLYEYPRSWTDSWCVFRLRVGANGALTGRLLAEGYYRYTGPYSSEETVLSAAGTLRTDVTPPVITLVARSPHGPAHAMLPWDELQAVVSEGVDATAFSDHVRVQAAGAPAGESPIARWEPSYGTATGPEPDWIGAHLFKTRLADWTATGHLSLVASLEGPVPDLAGNAATLETPALPFMPVGPAADAIHFGASAGVASWGRTSLPSPGDPDACGCEDGSCALVGPVDGESFDAPLCSFSAGVAFRVRTAGKTKVRLRYRMLLDAAAASLEDTGSGLYVLDVIRPDGERSEHPIPSPAEATSLPSACGAMTHATPWQTMDAPVSGDAEVGLMVRPYFDSHPECRVPKQRLHELVLESAEAI